MARRSLSVCHKRFVLKKSTVQNSFSGPNMVFRMYWDFFPKAITSKRARTFTGQGCRVFCGFWQRDFRRITRTVRTPKKRVTAIAKNNVFYRHVKTNRLKNVVSVSELLMLNVSSLARMSADGFRMRNKKNRGRGVYNRADRTPDNGRLIDRT